MVSYLKKENQELPLVNKIDIAGQSCTFSFSQDRIRFCGMKETTFIGEGSL